MLREAAPSCGEFARGNCGHLQRYRRRRRRTGIRLWAWRAACRWRSLLQHEVMIEAVENQNPEVIVIDEIGENWNPPPASTISERACNCWPPPTGVRWKICCSTRPYPT